MDRSDDGRRGNRCHRPGAREHSRRCDGRHSAPRSPLLRARLSARCWMRRCMFGTNKPASWVSAALVPAASAAAQTTSVTTGAANAADIGGCGESGGEEAGRSRVHPRHHDHQPDDPLRRGEHPRQPGRPDLPGRQPGRASTPSTTATAHGTTVLRPRLCWIRRG